VPRNRRRERKAGLAMQERNCALVVIGNEILSGKIHDTNTFFAARELRAIGVTLQRIAVVPDELDAIAEEVRYCSQRFGFVITSGGVGPTHDDITIAGVAAALGRPVVIHPRLDALIREHFGDRPNNAGMKMAEVPEGAVLIEGGPMIFPTVQVENIYMLPGIPQLFEGKLLAIKPRFATDPYFARAIYSSAGEGRIASILDACLERFPKLLLGSYPKIGNSEYRVKVTLESKERDYVDDAFRYLLELLPGDVIVKTE
jgi:molybdenum cofactor synthesis domain-containing protein